MLKLELLNSKAINLDEMIVRQCTLDHQGGYGIVFAKPCKMPNSLLDWMCDNGVRFNSYFNYQVMQIRIPLHLIVHITPHKGEIPIYVPNPDFGDPEI